MKESMRARIRRLENVLRLIVYESEATEKDPIILDTSRLDPRINVKIVAALDGSIRIWGE